MLGNVLTTAGQPACHSDLPVAVQASVLMPLALPAAFDMVESSLLALSTWGTMVSGAPLPQSPLEASALSCSPFSPTDSPEDAVVWKLPRWREGGHGASHASDT